MNRPFAPFDGKLREARDGTVGYALPMIERTMSAGVWASLLLLGLIWGGAFFFIDVAVAEVAPFTFVLSRVGLAAAALWLLLAWRGEARMLDRRAIGALAVLALLNNALPFSLFAFAQTRIDGGLASILNATSPIWTVLIAHVATRDEPMTRWRFIGVMLGFAGVAVMIGADLGGLGNGGTWAQLACLGGALAYALAGVWARRFRAWGIRPIEVAAWQLALAALLLLPLVVGMERPWTAARPSTAAIGAIVALALVCSAFAYILYFRIIDRAGATNALLVTLISPPVAILLSALFLDERLSLADFGGLLLIGLGLIAIDGRLLRRRS